MLGTANLFGLVGTRESLAVLYAAEAQGISSFDTAPSYGYGHCEPAIGHFINHSDPAARITTKVGIIASPRPAFAVRGARSIARFLPAAWMRRIPRHSALAGHGHFRPDEIRESIESSLRRLHYINRLMLHEVRPDDITDELLACLTAYVQQGDVGQLGIATSNELTPACLGRAPGIFEAVHISVGPFAAPPELPESVTVRVGHGILGPGGADVRRLNGLLKSDPELAGQWRETVCATHWGNIDGLAAALIARSATVGLTEIIVATSRPTSLPRTCALVSGRTPTEPAVHALLERLISMATDADSHRVGRHALTNFRA